MSPLVLLWLAEIVLPPPDVMAWAGAKGTTLTVWLAGLVLLTLLGERFYAYRADTPSGQRACALFVLATTLATLAWVISAVKSL